MSRNLKWLLVVFIILVVVNGVLLMGYLMKKNGQSVNITKVGKEKEIPKTFLLANRENIRVEVSNKNGLVKIWKPEDGLLTAEINGISETFRLNTHTSVMIPFKMMTEEGIYSISAESPHWETAFCEGDSVLVAVDKEDSAQSVMNMGPRPCGLEGKIE